MSGLYQGRAYHGSPPRTPRRTQRTSQVNELIIQLNHEFPGLMLRTCTVLEASSSPHRKALREVCYDKLNQTFYLHREKLVLIVLHMFRCSSTVCLPQDLPRPRAHLQTPIPHSLKDCEMPVLDRKHQSLTKERKSWLPHPRPRPASDRDTILLGERKGHLHTKMIEYHPSCRRVRAQTTNFASPAKHHRERLQSQHVLSIPR